MAGRRQYSDEADRAIVAGVASGMSVDEIRRTLVESGLATISRSTVGSRVAQLRGPVRNSKNRRANEPQPPAPQPPCTACGKLSKGFSPSGVCQSCANQAARLARAPEGTTWITLPNGAIRREAKCHPGRPIVAHDLCSACYAAERPPKWVSDDARAKRAAKKALALRERAAREGRVVRPRTPPAMRKCGAEGCDTMLVAYGKRYCSAECRPLKVAPTAVQCLGCEAMIVGRKTCSRECLARYFASKSTVGHRSESVRAKRRKQKRSKYRRPDKATVIAALTARQQGRCKVCGSDGEERGLVLDHCHTSGDARAMLCVRCNAAFGLMRESSVAIRGLLAYAQEVEQLPRVTMVAPHLQSGPNPGFENSGTLFRNESDVSGIDSGTKQ